MGSNFSAIGVTENIEAFVERALDEGEPADAGRGATLRWYEQSGAGVFVHALKDRIECVTPAFDATQRTRVQFDGYLEDGECRFCSCIQVAVLEDGEMVFPFNLQLADAVAVRPYLPDPGELIEIAPTFFAQAVELHADEAAFDAAQADEELRYAVPSFIPAGMFGGTPSLAMFTGIVVDADERTNTASGGAYYHAVVDTLGMRVDVVLDPADFDHRPEPGEVLSGEFWGCGRVVGGLRSEPRATSFFGKLRGLVGK